LPVRAKPKNRGFKQAMYSSRYIITTLFFLVFFAALVGSLTFFTQQVPLTVKPPQQADPVVGKTVIEPPLPQYYDRSGEQIIYSVNMGKITIGFAVFNCLPNIQENGRVLAVMTFETKIKGFQDKETIYSDALTLLPARVDRDIQSMLKHENLIEKYDHRDFTLTVIKKNGQKEGAGTVFKNDSPIHNAVLLPYYVRTIPELKIGYSLTANFARRRFEIKLVSIENIIVPAGEYKTYHFESIPKQVEIWLSVDKDRIPVKIQGIGRFSYSLNMTSYKPPQKPAKP
jgi:hypothetical protein